MKIDLLRHARPLRSLLSVLVGEVSWRPPSWARAAGARIARQPFATASLFILLILCGLGLRWAASLWKHRPVPLETNWIVTAPAIPEPSDQFIPQPLSLTFDRSIARLESIGQPVKSGVTLSPPLRGTWRWAGDTTLVFDPLEDWPAGTTFSIRLDRSLFSPQARLATLQKNFQTPAFTVALSDLNFYINPVDPRTRQITATLTFSNPVNRASLEAGLRLTAQDEDQLFGPGSPQTARRTITYAKRDRIAYVRSASLQLPQHSGYAKLEIADDVRSASGGADLEKAVEREVLIPSLFDLFKFDSAEVVIATDPEGEPSQALVVHSTIGVKSEALARAVHAFVLPQRPPSRTSTSKIWDGPAQITPALLEKLSPVKLDPIATDKEYDNTRSFHLKVPENAQLYVTIDQGTVALGGFPLGQKYDVVCTVPPYQREIRLLHKGALLALNGERKLSVLSRGVEELEYRIARVTPGEINHLVSQSEGSFENPIFNRSNFGESDLTELSVTRQAIASPNPGAADYSSFDLSDLVKDDDANDGKLGLFLVHILGRRPGKDGGYYQSDGNLFTKEQQNNRRNTEGERQDPSEIDSILSERRLILVTDLGLLVKDNADKTHDVFVQSIKTGGPVGGAKVQVLGKNGLPLVSTETDDHGRASIPSLNDFTRERRPVAYVVQRGRDVAFLPFGRADRELNFSRFDTGGAASPLPSDLSALVFTDRGLYRPGDTAHLGLIVKQHDWLGHLAGVPLELDIIDPRGRQAETRIVKCDATGFIDSDFQTRETSPTGEYQINCYLVKGDGEKTLLGSNDFTVREFLPDRLKIALKLLPPPTEGWVAQRDLSALVTLENLYGSFAIGHRITGKVTLSPSAFHFNRYPDFSFADPYLDPNAPRRYVDEDLPEQLTADSGEAKFSLATKEMEPSAYRLSFLVEGFEKEGGRSVSTYAEALVSPSSWLLGVRPDADFNYVKEKTSRHVRLLAVDPRLKPIEGQLTLKLVERRSISVLTQQPNGNYAYDSVLKEIPVATQPVSVPAGGIDWPLVTTNPGDFAARFYNGAGDLMADVRYTVTGAGNLARHLEKNAELSVKLSQARYRPGDEIEISITAPYTGAGLITIERDKVYAAQWFKATTTSSVQKIRIPSYFQGDGYINVAFVRSLDSREIYESPLSYAVVPFRLDRAPRTTTIDIQAPPVAVPGQPLTWTVQASRPTRAVVYAVDEGILQVAGYTLPDPLEFFLQREALGVGTRQTVDLILPEYSVARAAAAAGGDGADDLLANHLNPFKRKTDQPVVFWSGVIDLGPQAKTFTYRVPDYFAGTLRFMVVAASPEAVGSAQATAQVRGPFVISPNVPTFLAPGDTFDLSVTIANNIRGSGPLAPVTPTLATTDGLEIIQKPSAPVVIAEGRDASVHWLIRARDLLGNADLTVTARWQKQTSSLASHLSVRPPVAYLTTVESGYFTGAEKNVTLTRRLYPQFRQSEAMASLAPQGLSRGLGLYLEHYEYGCTEQLVSKAFPSLVSSATMQQGQSQTEIVHHLDDIFAVLASRQNDQGAFGLWQAEPDLHFDVPSVWGVQFLTEVRERGYDVPADLLTRGLAHLQRMAEEEPGDFENARTQVEAIYLLTRNGVVTTNFLEHNREWFEQNARDTWGEDIACPYSASAYALLKNQKQADAMIGRFHLAGASLQAEDDYYNELGRDAEYIDLLALHFPERLRKLSAADLMALARPIMDGDYTTLSAAQAVLALDAYGRTVGGKDNALASLSIDERAGKTARPVPLTTGHLYQSGPFGLDADALVFHKPALSEVGLPGLFYQVTEAGFDHKVVTAPISEGMEVSREYRDLKGNPAASVKMGGQLNVVLRVRGLGDRDITNVAVLDLLPGGFEVVPESIQTGGCRFDGIDYADVREDRVAAFGTISNRPTDITYRIRATNKGTYAVPPPQAEAMYHLKIRARGASGSITVTE